MKRSLLLFLLYTSIIGANNKVILLTGGAGFIGSHTAEALLQRGYTVVIVDNLNNYYNPTIKIHNLDLVKKKDPTGKNLRIYQDDICNPTALKKIFELEKPSIICHLAAYAGVTPSIKNPELYLHTNIASTFNLLELAKDFKITNFVFASSSSVYGNDTPAPFSELEIADKPCSPYAMTKRSNELLAYTYHHLYGIPCSGLRFFTVYGPRGRIDMAPFKFFDAIYNGKPIYLFGDGNTRMRDFTYISDIVDGVIKAIERPHDFEIFNLGRGKPVTLNEFIQTIECVNQKKAHIIQKEVPAGDVDLTFADISKAQAMLGYSPQVSLYEGLSQTFDWYINEYLPMINKKLS